MANDHPASGPGPAGPPGIPGGTSRMPAGPERFRAVLDNLDEVVFETDPDGRWTYLNAAWTKITGWPVDESLGRPFLEHVHPDEHDATVELFERVVHGPDDHCKHETRYLSSDGSYRWIELRASMLFDEQGEYIGNVGTILDITDRRRAEELLDEQNRMLAEHNGLLEMVARAKPLEETLGAIAHSLARWTGYEVVVTADFTTAGARTGHLPAGSRTAVLARPDQPQIVPLPPGETVAAPASDQLEIPVYALNGDVRLGRFLLRSTDSIALLGERKQSVVDRTVHLAAIAMGREQLDAEARHKALHDPLTGLPNRTLVTDRLEQALRVSGRLQRRVALLLLDLDHFKVINDSFGHPMGDRVLQQVAERLQHKLRESDTIGRLGGDEFAVVLPDVALGAEARDVAENLRAALRAPLRLDGVDFHLEASIGIAVGSGPQDDPADLLRYADVAMYRAKREGVGHARYDPDLDAARLRGFDLIGQLHYAIRHDQLVLHYQPRVDLDSGRVTGIEGLVRWEHPVRGLIGPTDFVPLANMTGAVRPLLRWVLREALEDSRSWTGFDGSIAVNISAQSLHDPELPRVVGDLLRDDARAGGRCRLELEITEDAIMVDPEGAAAAMSRLEDLGVSFSIDDFGTGYSSLTYLKMLPARALKIDQSFVKEIDRDERDAFIVRTAVALGHDLDLDVTAEGVESEAVRDLLRELDCDSAQGFFFARPMPADELSSWLEDQRSSS